MENSTQGVAISVGAGNHQVPLIAELKRQNFLVAAFDQDPMAPGRFLADFFSQISTWDFTAAADWLDSLNTRFVGVFCFSYGKALTTQLRLIEKYNLEGLVTPCRADLSHDKFAQRQFLREAGLTKIIDVDCKHSNKIDNQRRYVVKDRHGGSSKGIEVFEGEQLSREIGLSPESFSNSVAQPILNGSEYRVIIFVRNGQIFFGTALRRHNLPGTFICSTYHTLIEVPIALIELSEKLVNLLGQPMYFLKIDVMEVDWGMEIIEFDLGKPGDYFESLIAPFCFSLDFIRVYVDAYLGRSLRRWPCWQPPKVQGTLHFLYEEEFSVDNLQDNFKSAYLGHELTGQPGSAQPKSNQDVRAVLLVKRQE